jgi:hypothetical protein
MPSSESEEECKRLYGETRADLLKRQLSNAENYDKAILSVATATLGFSLVFLKDIVPTPRATDLWVLKMSWFLLSMAIISTLSSFISSQAGINAQLKYAEKYYLGQDEKYLNKTNWPARITDYLNIASGGFFVLAIIATICFVSTNISGGPAMTKGSKNTSNPLREGASIPSMQKVPAGGEGRGAPVPAMQAVTQSQGAMQSQPATQSQANPTTGQQGNGGAQIEGNSPKAPTP